MSERYGLAFLRWASIRLMVRKLYPPTTNTIRYYNTIHYTRLHEMISDRLQVALTRFVRGRSHPRGAARNRTRRSAMATLHWKIGVTGSYETQRTGSRAQHQAGATRPLSRDPRRSSTTTGARTRRSFGPDDRVPEQQHRPSGDGDAEQHRDLRRHHDRRDRRRHDADPGLRQPQHLGRHDQRRRSRRDRKIRARPDGHSLQPLPVTTNTGAINVAGGSNFKITPYTSGYTGSVTVNPYVDRLAAFDNEGTIAVAPGGGPHSGLTSNLGRTTARSSTTEPSSSAAPTARAASAG